MNFPRFFRFVAAAAVVALAGCSGGVLDPKGPVGAGERTILFDSLAIMLAIVVPTVLATIAFAWWFRARNASAVHRPEWAYSGQIELVVWAVPAMVVLLLSGIAWIGSHRLEPSRPLAATPALEIEVVSLDWKWLFLYPQQGIATVNRLVVPAGVPVHFRLTSASVMNSFFVPQLGSQIYTMAGMATQLNLQADRPGRYAGMSAQYSGAGFADMRFTMEAVSQAQFTAWMAAQKKAAMLDAKAYVALAKPSSNLAPASFGSVVPGLFETVVRMHPLQDKR